MAAAGDQLLGLREEFDFADAPSPDLDVVTFHRDLALAAIGLHLPLHVVHIGKRCKIEMLAPDKGRDVSDHGLSGLDVAGTDTRLDHGGALPGPDRKSVV